MKLNELNLSHVLGDYGAAAIKQAGKRLVPGGAEGNLSVQDKIAKDKFIADFIGRANTNLNSAIQSGLVDPKIKADPAGGETTPPEQGNEPTTPQPNTAQDIGAPKTPEEIRKEKQAAAAKVAQDDMAANPLQPKTTTGPATTPAGTVHKASANNPNVAGQTPYVQGRAGSGPNATRFAKYDPETSAMARLGQGMNNMIRSGTNESKYKKLDYILESIINIDEAQEAQSISEYLQNMFNQYLGIPITDPKAKAQVKTLADLAQASYPRMKDALTKMANLGFAISYSQGSGATQSADATTSQPTSGASAFSQGMNLGLGSSSSTAAQDTSTTKEPEQLGSAYDQIVKLVDKLSKEEKQKLVTMLQEPQSAPEEPTSDAGAGAFGQMSKQLQEPKSKTSTVSNRQQKLNTNKVKAGNKGAPTPDEQAKFDKLIQQKLAAQP